MLEVELVTHNILQRSLHDFVHHVKVPFAVHNKPIRKYLILVTCPAAVDQRLLLVNPRSVRLAMSIKIAHQNDLTPLLLKTNDQLVEQRCLFDLFSTGSGPKVTNNHIQTGGTAM